MAKTFPIYMISGLVGLLALYSGLTGKRVPFINDTRSAVIWLTAAGFIMCSTGTIFIFVTKAPAHPLSIASYILGAVAMLVGAVQIFKINIPFLRDPYKALIVLAVIIIVKVVVGRLNYILS
jgi:hypothetical protein